MQSSCITFLSGSRQGFRFNLPTNREIRIGRSPGAEIQLLDDLVSRHHARIQVGSMVTIHDLGSRNGTFVNGRKVDRTTIESGDRILIGTAVAEVWVTSRALSGGAPTRLTATMAGQLSEIPLVDVLQLLAAAKKTGVVGIATQAHQARVEVYRGNVVRASIEGIPYDDFKAFTRILGWREGDFSLLPAEAEPSSEEPLMGSMQRALMEVMRQVDELARIVERLGGPSSILIAPRTAPPPLKEIPRAIVRMARDEGRTVQACLDAIAAPDLEIAQHMVALLEHGSLEAQLGGGRWRDMARGDESLRLDLAFAEDDSL